MIELIGINKSFEQKGHRVDAVKDANITIHDGEIFGFIGYSGAGKSTIVRCINLLERPTSGQVLYDGVDLTKLSDKELRAKRKEIGMIFQQFNLLSSLTVGENIAFNLRDSGLRKDEIEKRVDELLDLVSLPDKKHSYPSQLSGGQKQRVAIARALANNPKVILCDEATSALDPQTTKQILDLLKDLNNKFGITIIVITHEMQVIKSICDRVAVMENGRIVEVNNVYNLFSDPKEKISQEFVNSTSNKHNIEDLIRTNRDFFGKSKDAEFLLLDFFGENTNEAIISQISQKFDIACSIIFGDVDIIDERILGKLIISVDGDIAEIQKAKAYLDEKQVRWESIV